MEFQAKGDGPEFNWGSGSWVQLATPQTNL